MGSPRWSSNRSVVGSQQEPVVVVAAEVEHPGRPRRRAGLGPPDPALRARQGGPGGLVADLAPPGPALLPRVEHRAHGVAPAAPDEVARAVVAPDDDGVVVTTCHGHLRWAGRGRRPPVGGLSGRPGDGRTSNTCSTPTTVTLPPDIAS